MRYLSGHDTGMYEERSSAGLLEQDRNKGRETLSGDYDARTAVGESEKGGGRAGSETEKVCTSAPFSVKDTLVLKGMAILAIALHNYYHLLGPVSENEFNFKLARSGVFVASIGDRPLQALLSFAGHYGVQIFIFLSAYGLAVRYWDTSETWAEFMWSRVKKIYPMFLLAISCWLFYLAAWRINPAIVLYQQFGPLLLTFLGVENIVPHYDLPPVGPWWFFVFIVQFYSLWPCMRWMVKRHGFPALAILSACSLASIYLVNGTLISRWSINLMETPIGHMPEICFGILAARYGFIPGQMSGFIGALMLVAGNVYRPLWPLSFAGALLLILWSYQIAADTLRCSAALTRLGQYSMALFFVNGFVRLPFVIMAREYNPNDSYIGSGLLVRLLLGLISTLLAIEISRVLCDLEKRSKGLLGVWLSRSALGARTGEVR